MYFLHFTAAVLGEYKELRGKTQEAPRSTTTPVVTPRTPTYSVSATIGTESSNSGERLLPTQLRLVTLEELVLRGNDPIWGLVFFVRLGCGWEYDGVSTLATPEEIGAVAGV